jgi:glycyl-tRNA synthetase beta chain
VADFLLELLSEEIPARMQEKASADLHRLFEAEIAKAGLTAGAIETYATPRRLALIARGLPAATEAVSEETKGPKSSAPPQALDGFLRKTGLTREQLIERDGILFAIVEKPGRATADVLAEAIPAIIRGFPWPKSMRWGTASASTASLRWVRPLQGIIALLGEDVVPFEIDGIQSGAATYGHRFHHPGIITIGSASDYAEKLRACHVILDPAERRGIIEGGARALAQARGLSVIPDAGLVAENAGLTEWPVPLLGDFDPAFLEVPREVIQLTMRTNQKYFACVDASGKLAPNFICTANIVAEDGGAAIVNGNRKVLAARLSDAKFFWEQDLKVPLAEQAKKLDQIVFHEKLGTVAQKVDRVAKLARWLVEEGVVPPIGTFPGESRGPAPAAELDPGFRRGTEERTRLADMAEQAARLAKADLVTGMVGEFPELQGVMGGYYAHAEGLPHDVAEAIRDHYMPVGQGDDVPTAPVTIAVSLADKLDSLQQFFGIGETPTGSKDPFALRRSALGIIRLLTTNGLRFRIPGDLLEFFADRLKVQQREAGVRHDLIDAVFALGGEDDLVRLLARVKALQGFVSTEDGVNLLAGYKRAANILRKEGWDISSVIPAQAGIQQEAGAGGEMDPGLRRDDGESAGDGVGGNDGFGGGSVLSYQPEPAESALIAALDTAEAAAESAVRDENFEGAMAALAGLRGPIDAFFDSVTVNDADPAKRAARLALLARIRRAVHRVADFSRIEG